MSRTDNTAEGEAEYYADSGSLAETPGLERISIHVPFSTDGSLLGHPSAR